LRLCSRAPETTIALDGGIDPDATRANRRSSPGAAGHPAYGAARCATLLSVRLAPFLIVPALLAAGCGAAAARQDSTSAPTPTKRAATVPGPLTVWGIGDAEPGFLARRLAALVRRERPSRFLYLGDVYETGTAREFRKGYEPLYGALATRTIPTPGNHEWGNRAVGYEPYWTGKLGRPPGDWSRHAIGSGWEVLSLNSEAPHDAGSPQLGWLRAAVRRPGTCRIAIWHRPRWSSGWHGDQADMAPVWQALRGHARIVLSGHDHDLQRFSDVDGMRQVVAGGGGRPNIPIPHPSKAKVRFVNRLTPGGARLRLTRGHAVIELVDSSGAVLDRSSAGCVPVS
jgi:hypothetical protein